MPHAVVVGTDATALHVGSQLAARGFQVTLLEATQKIGGQWVQRLFADNADSDYNAADDGVFVDYPWPRPTNSNKPDSQRGGVGAGVELNDESIGALGSGIGKAAWVEQPKPRPSLAPAPDPSLPKDQQLLRHLAEYAQAAGLHRSVRLGCTLRRAKWQAMNGCWRLELATVSPGQRGGSQLSADLLVVSRQAVAAARLPHLPGSELYCGTVLTANDQLSGPGGSAVLEQQLRGRNVLVVGPAGPVAAGWAEACRRHAGCGGSVVLLEIEEETEDGGGAVARQRTATGQGGGTAGGGGGGGLLSRLFGSCFSGGGGGERSSRRHGAAHLDRFSPAHAPTPARGGGGGCRQWGAAGERGSGGSPEPGSGPSGALEDGEGDGEGDGETEAVELGTDPQLATVGKLDDTSTGPMSAAVGEGDTTDGGEAEPTVRKHHDGSGAGGGRCGGGRKLRREGGASDGEGGGGGLAAGRSSLRVLRGVGALLNGTHVMLSTGEELPAEVLLLVPLGGVETSLAFLDAGAPVRISQAGGSSAGGSFRRGTTSLAEASASMASLTEPLSRQLRNVYRDMLSGSPFAPNLALVGAGARASQHDARTAALQAAWLLATWTAHGDPSASGRDGGGGGGAAAGAGLGGAAARGGGGGSPVGGFLRQALPVEAAEDMALRARWRREAARRGRPELYLHRYLMQLLADLGSSPPVRSPWRCAGGNKPLPGQLTRQRVAKLLGIRRLRRPCQSVEEGNNLSRGQSPRASPGRSQRYYSCNGGAFAPPMGAAAAAAAAAAAGFLDRGSGLTSRETSRTTCHGGFARNTTDQNSAAFRHSNSAALAARGAGGVPRGSGFVPGLSSGSFFELPVRSESSFPAAAVVFASQPGPTGDNTRAPSAGCLPSQQQLADSYLSIASQHQLHYSHSGLSASKLHNLPAGGPSNTGHSLSFALGSNQLMLSHDLQLYRVAEHPAEHLGDSTAGGGGGSRVGIGGGGARGAPLLVRSPSQQVAQAQMLPSCPSSPGMALAAAMYASAGSISGSIGSLRSRLLASNGGASFTTAAGGGGGALTAGSVVTSPCNLAGYGGVDGAAVAAAGVISSAATAPAAGTSLLSNVAGGAGDEAAGAAPGGGGGCSQQFLRSQLLQRHRSTSRLAGMSNASSLPSASQTQGGVASATLNHFFGRRAPAVSTSQVSFDIPKSFLMDRRSQSGRPSNPSGSCRRGNHLSAGGAGSCNGGSTALLGRANSAVRLQLLLAAASSASRRRTARAPASPAASGSSDPYSYSPVGGVGGGSRYRLQKAHSEALQPVNSASERMMYGSRLPCRAIGGAASYHSGAVGAGPGGLGASVAVIARAARVSGGAGNNPHGSMSEPVRGDVASCVASEPSSPPRNAVYAYGKIGETVSALLPEDTVADGVSGPALAAGTADAVGTAGRASGSAASGDFMTGQLHWGDSDTSLPQADGGGGGGGDASGSASGSRGLQPVGRRRTRRRSITLPDLRLGGAGHLLHEYAEQYLAEDDAFGDCDGDSAAQCDGGDVDAAELGDGMTDAL